MEKIKGAQEESNKPRKQVDKLAEKAHVHSGNIPGIQQYLKSTYHKFKATTFTTITQLQQKPQQQEQNNNSRQCRHEKPRQASEVVENAAEEYVHWGRGRWLGTWRCGEYQRKMQATMVSITIKS